MAASLANTAEAMAEALDIFGRGGEMKKQDIKELFWSKVAKTDDCWNWTGHAGKKVKHQGVALRHPVH